MKKEEALEQIRKWDLLKEEKEALETLIPELKESEDERIRKWLLGEMKIHYDFESPNLNPMVEKALAWLEKQKEQKPAEWGEEDNEEDIQTRFAFYTYKDDPCTLYLSNVFVEETSRNKGFGKKILTAAEKVAETFGVTYIRLKVKQGSSANAWYRKNGYGYVAFEDGYDWLEKNLEYMNPNKQEWDEFDEDCLKRAVWYIENPATSVVKDTNLALWLKSLPGRFNLQSKQEWSDEDEACIRNLESIIYYDKKLPNDTRVILGKFLSNLRPQPQGTYKQVIHTIFGMLKDKDFYEIQPSHRVSLLNDIRVKCKDAIECAPILDEPSWKPGEVCYGPKGDPDPAGVWKPSEEQMEALQIAAMESKTDFNTLTSLLADLMKL